ncbi:unnamed protein product [Rhizophagus irregularis]|nr:unnamed protein product [Rhizophagus irregularis]
MDNNMKSRKPCSLEWNKLFTDFYEVEATSEIPRNEIAEILGTTNIKGTSCLVSFIRPEAVNESNEMTNTYIGQQISNNTMGSRASSTEKLLIHVDDDFDYLYGIVTLARDLHFLLYNPDEINQASEIPHTIEFNKKALDKRS